MNIEELWENLLSEEPEKIHLAWNGLTPEERAAVREHLHRMSTEDGWHPAQQQAAVTARRILREQTS